MQELTKYHVRGDEEGPRVGDGRAARSRHGRRVINGWPAVSQKTILARERVEERRAREQYRDGERLERRRDVHAIHAVQDLLRHTIRCALKPSAGHVPEAGLGDVSQARLRRIIQPEREEQPRQ